MQLREPATRASKRALIGWVLRLLATVIALALIALWLPVDQLWSAISALPPVAWPLAVLVYLLAHLVGVVKWRLLVNAAGAGLTGPTLIQAYYWGLFGNLFLPSIVGGDVVRAGVAMRHSRSGSALVLGSVVDRVQDVVGLGVLAGFGSLLVPRSLDEDTKKVFVAFVILAVSFLALTALAIRFFPVRRLPWRARRLLARIRQALRATASSPHALVTAFMLGLGIQSTFILLNWRLGQLIGIDIALSVWFVVWPLAKIAGLAPITQGGIGVREAALAALFLPFGVPAVQAVATGFVFEAVIIVGGLLSGLIAVAMGRVRRAPGAKSARPRPQHAP